MSNNIFSLEIGPLHTKIAHLATNKGKIELLSLGLDNTVTNYFTNQNDKSALDQARLITNLYKQLNIDASKVHVVLPDSMSYFQLMVMPNLKEEELAKSIRLQMEEFVPFSLNDVNIDFEVIEKIEQDKLLLLFIALQKKVANHVAKTLENANLEPLSLEIDTSAVGRLLFEFTQYFKEPSLVINFGYSSSTIYIVNPPYPYFYYLRTVKIGLYNMIRDIKMNINLDDTKILEALRTIGLSNNNTSVKLYPILYPIFTELINEINKTILLSKERFKGKVNKIYTFNYDMHVAHLHQNLQNILSIPVQSINLDPIVVPNPITQSFHNNLSAFLPVIAAHIR